jgi:putative phosphoribosyl transferase
MNGLRIFNNREEAGTLLAEAIKDLNLGTGVIVLGLPRGGVPVAERVATLCAAPLDIFMVRKIGCPSHEELAAGAVASGGTVVWNESVLRTLGLTKEDLQEVVRSEERELRSRELAIRSSRTPPLALQGATVVLVDDGIATGATIRAAVKAIKQMSPKKVVVALPVGPDDTCREIEGEERCRVVCLTRVDAAEFGSVGSWYRDFSQVQTQECKKILEKSRRAELALGRGHHAGGGIC